METTLIYCDKTDTIRTEDNLLLLHRHESIWSNIWMLTFDYAVDVELIHLTYLYLQQATGFTKDGNEMVKGLNKYIYEDELWNNMTLNDKKYRIRYGNK